MEKKIKFKAYIRIPTQGTQYWVVMNKVNKQQYKLNDWLYSENKIGLGMNVSDRELR